MHSSTKRKEYRNDNIQLQHLELFQRPRRAMCARPELRQCARHVGQAPQRQVAARRLVSEGAVMSRPDERKRKMERYMLIEEQAIGQKTCPDCMKTFEALHRVYRDTVDGTLHSIVTGVCSCDEGWPDPYVDARYEVVGGRERTPRPPKPTRI